MKISLKKGAALILAAALLLTAMCMAMSAAAGGPSVTGYTVTDLWGRALTSFSKGASVNLTVTVKDTSVTTDAVSATAIDASKLLDSFTGGTVAVTVSSTGTDPLVYSVSLKGVTYRGEGKMLKLLVGYKGLGTDYETLEIPISEAVEYTAVTSEPEKVVVPEPMLIVTRSAIGTPIAAGQEFSVVLTVKNAGQTTVRNPAVSITAPDALWLTNDISVFQPGDIGAGQIANITLKFKAAAELSASSQSVGVDIRYTYDNGSGLTQASYSDKVNIPTKAAESTSSQTTDGPVPNVIISDFGCGGDSVAAGSNFTLSINFKNTGSIEIGNLVAVIDGGESFTMNGSTNTFFFNAIKAGGVQNLKVPMQALSGAKTGAQSVEVAIRYEYVDGGKRSSANTAIKLSIPVYQPDRFTLDQPQISDYIYVGSESMITLSFVNKGKSDISNVQATLEGDVTIPSKTQYLGNFEAGKSGTISFAVTPNTAGETPVKITISYEDPNQQLKSQEFNVTLYVQGNDDTVDPDPYPEPEPVVNTGLPVWAWVAIGVGAAAVVVIVIVAVKKHKKSDGGKADAAWEDWEEVPASDKGDTKPQETKKGV